MSKTKSELEKILSQGPRTDLSETFSKASGVALLLYGLDQNLELLFIKRASNPRDRWSGQIAFPGGKQEPQDPSVLAACLREVREEIGVSLSSEWLLGSLDDIQARKRGHLLDFYIHPFVFHLMDRPQLTLETGEVEKAFWLPVRYLMDPANATTHTYLFEGKTLELPGILLPEGDMLWGLTLMMIQNFLMKIYRQ